jgi:hypothetical protein
MSYFQLKAEVAKFLLEKAVNMSQIKENYDAIWISCPVPKGNKFEVKINIFPDGYSYNCEEKFVFEVEKTDVEIAQL